MTTPAPKLLPSPTELTLADDGATVHLRVGERFVLNLDSSYGWTIQVGSQQILRRVGDREQGVYEATQPGQTTLMAIGTPPCCGNPGPPNWVLRVQVEVQ